MMRKEAGMAQTPQKRIKARVQRTKKVFVHNDLSQAATYFADNISEKLEKGSRDAIMLDGMACGMMVAFTFEANLNFMGLELLKSGKLPEWNEWQSHSKKLNKVFGALGIPVDLEKRPLKSMQRMKDLRDTLAHGKPVVAEYDQIEVGTHDELQSKPDLLAGWEQDCTSDSVFEALADLDDLWKLMIEKSGLDLWDTMTSAERSMTFIEHVD
jgi:hypothetical protein